jgi:hypothetical protein
MLTLTNELVTEVAAEADTDERSVVKRLAGLPVRGRAGPRIDRALERRGLRRPAKGWTQ